MSTKWWERVEMPTGKIDLPDWCLDARIHWHDGYANWPELKVKAAHCPVVSQFEKLGVIRWRAMVAILPRGIAHCQTSKQFLTTCRRSGE